VIADRAAYDVRMVELEQTAVWNSRGQEWMSSIFRLLIYSFELRSAFGAGSLVLMLVSILAVRRVVWLNDTAYTKSV